jgi:hypothetical protein
VAPRPGFEPGSSGRQPLILFRQHEKIHTVTGLYYLGFPTLFLVRAYKCTFCWVCFLWCVFCWVWVVLLCLVRSIAPLYILNCMGFAERFLLQWGATPLLVFCIGWLLGGKYARLPLHNQHDGTQAETCQDANVCTSKPLSIRQVYVFLPSLTS